MDTPAAHPAPASKPDPVGTDPAPEQAAPSAFSQFLAHAQARRAAPPPETGETPDWAHADPEAVAALPAHRRPAARLLARRGGRPKTRAGLTATLAQVCRLVQDADGVPTPARRPQDAYPWHHIDVDHAERYRRLIQARYPNVGTRNVMTSLLREVLRECRRAGLISAARFEALLEQLPTTSPGRTSRGRRLLPTELSAVLTACRVDPEPYRAARDAAIIAVFAVTGVRASELAALNVEDWDPDQRSLYLVTTKNRRDHTVFLSAAAAGYLQRWLDLRGGAPDEPLFTMVVGDRTRRITYIAVREMLRTRATQAGVRRFGSHDFRRTVATTLLRTHDTLLVSRILGHASVASTAVYDLAGDDECRAAVETLPMPPLDDPSTAPSPGPTTGSTDTPGLAA